jgi:hypothetical protein
MERYKRQPVFMSPVCEKLEINNFPKFLADECRLMRLGGNVLQSLHGVD